MDDGQFAVLIPQLLPPVLTTGGGLQLSGDPGAVYLVEGRASAAQRQQLAQFGGGRPGVQGVVNSYALE